MQDLRQLEKIVILQLPVDGEQMSYEQLSEKIGKDKGTVAKIASWLREKQMVAISEEIDRKIRLGPEGLFFLSKGFPERRLVKAILDLGGRCSFKDAEARSGLSDKHMNVAILWGKRKNWIRIDRTNGQIILSADKEAEKCQDEMLVETLTDRVLDTEKLSPELRSGIDPLTKRPEVLEIVERRIRRLQLTEKGVKAAESLRREEAKLAELRREVTQLTPELISSGKWREVRLSRYDIKAPVAATWPGKSNPT